MNPKDRTGSSHATPSRLHAFTPFFLGLCLALTSPLAASAETAKPAAQASAPSSFPNLPYRSRWIGTTDRAAPTPGGKTAQGFYNPICTQPDQPCNGDPNHGDPRDAFGDGWDAILDTQVSGLTNNLERVTVFGKRESLWNALCISSECRTYELPLIEIAKQSPEPVSEVIFEFLGQVFIVLDKCVVTAPSNAVQTPDQDQERGYFLAKDSITQTYAGNSRMLRTGMRVDVRYPIGQTVRCLITETSTARGFKEITGLVRFLDGIPDASNSPCK